MVGNSRASSREPWTAALRYALHSLPVLRPWQRVEVLSWLLVRGVLGALSVAFAVGGAVLLCTVSSAAAAVVLAGTLDAVAVPGSGSSLLAPLAGALTFLATLLTFLVHGARACRERQDALVVALRSCVESQLERARRPAHRASLGGAQTSVAVASHLRAAPALPHFRGLRRSRRSDVLVAQAVQALMLGMFVVSGSVVALSALHLPPPPRSVHNFHAARVQAGLGAIHAAQEANYALTGGYTDLQTLKTQGLLAERVSSHGPLHFWVLPDPDGRNYVALAWSDLDAPVVFAVSGDQAQPRPFFALPVSP